MDTIRCMLDRTYYNNKPTGKDAGAIQKRLKATDITIKDLANELIRGCSFKPSFLNGTKDKNWVNQQLFALDFDEDTTIQEELNRCKKLNILPVFAYTSFNHTDKQHKFRLVFCMSEIIEDANTARNIQSILIKLFDKCDKQCSNLGRLFFGGKSLIYEGYNNRINYKELLTKYNNIIYNNKFRGLIVHSNKYINNTSYCVRKNPHKPTSDINYNVQAIKNGNIQYLQSVLNINKEVILPNEQEFYDYIKTEIDLPELLGIDNPSKFNCIVHDDTNPSAGIIIGDSGDYIYNCFGCGFKGNIIHVIQALTKKKTYQVIEYIKEIYKIKIVKTDWQQEQINILETNKQMLLNGDFEKYYPEVYKLIKRYISQLIMMHDIAIMNVRDENFIDENGDIVFFISNRELAKMLDQRQPTKVNQRNVLFAFLKLLKKLDKKEIPEEDLKKALEIQRKYKHQKIVNYFSLGDYDIFRMKESEERAKKWNENNMSMTGLSYEGIYRTFGHEIAWEVYPQHKNKFIKTDEGYKKVNRTTSTASDNRTNEIAIIIMNEINNKGYVVEKEIVEELKGKYGQSFAQTQIKRSLQEILEGYNLKRIRCNKEIKKQYKVDSKGYPFIIVKN